MKKGFFRLKAEATGRLLVTAAIAAGSGVLLGGQGPQDQQAPTFRSSVEAVQLSVIVTDRDGNPVSGLAEDEFEILENGSPRPITTFAAVNIPIERTERGLAEKDVLSNDGPPGRLYVIALDQMSSLSALRAHAILRRFVEQFFGPNDTAAVVLTTGGLSDSGQEFTSNPRLLMDAINRFDGGTSDMSDRLREKNFIGDFKSLMAFMTTLRGARKAMIFVSESIPVDAYDVVDRGRARFGGLFSEVDTDWIDALSFATRNNIAIYPIDPRGLTTGITGESEDGSTVASGPSLDDRLVLGGLAAVTGGFALTGSNNYTGAFERLVRENSTYYLLAFNSGVEKRDGRYVRLEVRVKRPGLQVRSTNGYVQPRGRPQGPPRRPSTVLAATWDAVASAITTSGVSMRVYAAPFRGRKNDKEATVTVAVEIAPSKLNLVEQDGAWRGVLEVVFATTDSKNKKKWPIWRHRAALALKPETYERVSHGALRVLCQLPLPEGRYQLRTSAGSAALAGSVVYDLDVPDFRDDFSLSGVALTSAQARETFTFSPHPQLDVAMPGPPTTAREFSRDDTLTLFAEGYENRKKPHTITFSISLRDDGGRILGSHVIERQALEKPKQVSVYAFAPNLSLEEVPPGRYALHVEAHSSLDNRKKSVTRDIPFSVR
jgi:VWFA-related protein